jgi:hypothetical protein
MPVVYKRRMLIQDFFFEIQMLTQEEKDIYSHSAEHIQV